MAVTTPRNKKVKRLNAKNIKKFSRYPKGTPFCNVNWDCTYHFTKGYRKLSKTRRKLLGLLED